MYRQKRKMSRAKRVVFNKEFDTIRLKYGLECEEKENEKFKIKILSIKRDEKL